MHSERVVSGVQYNWLDEKRFTLHTNWVNRRAGEIRLLLTLWATSVSIIGVSIITVLREDRSRTNDLISALWKTITLWIDFEARNSASLAFKIEVKRRRFTEDALVILSEKVVSRTGQTLRRGRTRTRETRQIASTACCRRAKSTSNEVSINIALTDSVLERSIINARRAVSILRRAARSTKWVATLAGVRGKIFEICLRTVGLNWGWAQAYPL